MSLFCLEPGAWRIVYFEFDRHDGGDITSCVRETGDVVYYGYDDVRRLTDETGKDFKW